MNNQNLQEIRIDIVKRLAIYQDPKKIVSFLSKVTITKFDEWKIYISSPNQFVLVQVQKFFSQDLERICKELWYVCVLNVDESLKDKADFAKLSDILTWVSEKKSTSISSNQISNKNEQKVDYWMTKMLSNYFGIMFDEKYKFENFVVGWGNEFAYNICLAISKNPGQDYNPLFIWWNVGLWKTHLMQATANAIIHRFPDKSVLYLPTTKFIDEVVDSIRKNKLNSFIKKFDWVDVLMLDDIQFLANKEKIQEILHNVFNEFVSKNKQIIISSDRPPKQLPTIEDRLRSRFWQWMIVDVSMPDLETRIAIITNYIKSKHENLNKDTSINHEIVHTIAQSMNDNIREIEWMLNSLFAKKKMLARDLVMADIYMAIKNLGYKVTESGNITNINNNDNLTWAKYNKFDRIVEQLCEENNISLQDLKSDSKKKHISQIRQQLMYIAKNDFWRTLERIWEYFGGKHYTSVIYAVDQYKNKLQNEKI